MPKTPKTKREISSSSDSDSDSNEPQPQPAKKAKSSGSGDKPAKKAEASGGGAKPGFHVVDGEPTWDLGLKKFVKIRSFKGKQYVDIREFYEDKDSGKLKPGKKGISLNMQQWDMFTQIFEEVNGQL